MNIIGIKPDKNSGIAVKIKDKSIHRITLLKIKEAMELVLYYHFKTECFVYLEDQRLKETKNKLLIKYITAWEEFLNEKNIPFELIEPPVKVNLYKFRQLTGWNKSVFENEKDAAMLCYNK